MKNIITIDEIEHSFQKEISTQVQILSWISLILINASNGYFIYVIKNKMNSLLDWLILMDCILCIFNCISIIKLGINSNSIDIVTYSIIPSQIRFSWWLWICFLDCLGRMHKVYYSPNDFFKEVGHYHILISLKSEKMFYIIKFQFYSRSLYTMSMSSLFNVKFLVFSKIFES